MKRYTVTVTSVFYDISANSEDEAEEIVKKKIIEENGSDINKIVDSFGYYE